MRLKFITWIDELQLTILISSRESTCEIISWLWRLSCLFCWTIYDVKLQVSANQYNGFLPSHFLDIHLSMEQKRRPSIRNWKHVSMAHIQGYWCGSKISPGRLILPNFTSMGKFHLSLQSWHRGGLTLQATTSGAKNQITSNIILWGLPCPNRGTDPSPTQTQ